MKCDELKAETIVPQGCALTLQMYPKAEVDAAIDELKTEHHKERDEYISMVHSREQKIKELEAKLEDAKATAYAESVDAGMRERRLKRALMLMGARLGKMGYLAFHNIEVKLDFFFDKEGRERAHLKKMQWKNVERKCRAMAEEYK